MREKLAIRHRDLSISCNRETPYVLASQVSTTAIATPPLPLVWAVILAFIAASTLSDETKYWVDARSDTRWGD
jgi:hypothetical protein